MSSCRRCHYHEASRLPQKVSYPNKESLPQLRRELKNKDHRIRLRAVEALGQISADGAAGLADPGVFTIVLQRSAAALA